MNPEPSAELTASSDPNFVLGGDWNGIAGFSSLLAKTHGGFGDEHGTTCAPPVLLQQMRRALAHPMFPEGLSLFDNGQNSAPQVTKDDLDCFGGGISERCNVDGTKRTTNGVGVQRLCAISASHAFHFDSVLSLLPTTNVVMFSDQRQTSYRFMDYVDPSTLDSGAAASAKKNDGSLAFESDDEDDAAGSRSVLQSVYLPQFDLRRALGRVAPFLDQGELFFNVSFDPSTNSSRGSGSEDDGANNDGTLFWLATCRGYYASRYAYLFRSTVPANAPAGVTAAACTKSFELVCKFVRPLQTTAVMAVHQGSIYIAMCAKNDFLYKLCAVSHEEVNVDGGLAAAHDEAEDEEDCDEVPRWFAKPLIKAHPPLVTISLLVVQNGGAIVVADESTYSLRGFMIPNDEEEEEQPHLPKFEGHQDDFKAYFSVSLFEYEKGIADSSFWHMCKMNENVLLMGTTEHIFVVDTDVYNNFAPSKKKDEFFKQFGNRRDVLGVFHWRKTARKVVQEDGSADIVEDIDSVGPSGTPAAVAYHGRSLLFGCPALVSYNLSAAPEQTQPTMLLKVPFLGN